MIAQLIGQLIAGVVVAFVICRITKPYAESDITIGDSTKQHTVLHLVR